MKTTLYRSAVIALVVVATVIALAPPSFGVRVGVRATSNNTWRPKHLFGQRRGVVVVWRNPTGRLHEVKSWNGGTDWSFQENLRPGTRASKRFRRRGTYWYRCRVNGHSSIVSGSCRGMCGVVHVTRG